MVTEENPPSVDPDIVPNAEIVAEFLDVGEGFAPLPPELSAGQAKSGHSQSARLKMQSLDVRALAARQLPLETENLAATGGAVAALVLGAWSVVAGFISDWSIVNCGLALVLGLWGRKSPKRYLAIIGIGLAGCGAIICTWW